MIEAKEATVKNFYTSVVESQKNDKIESQLNKYFEQADVVFC